MNTKELVELEEKYGVKVATVGGKTQITYPAKTGSTIYSIAETDEIKSTKVLESELKRLRKCFRRAANIPCNTLGTIWEDGNYTFKVYTK